MIMLMPTRLRHVEYTDCRKILYEVKNEYAAQSAKNVAKFEAARSNLINLG